MALLLASCSAQHKRKQLFFTVRGSNTYEYAGKEYSRYELMDELQKIRAWPGPPTDIVLIAPGNTPYSWVHPLQVLTSMRGYSEYRLTTNAIEPGQFFFGGSVGDSSTIWKSTEVNLEKGEFYLYIDEGRVARLDDPKAFWADTNYAHMAYIVASPTTTAQRLVHELDTLNSCKVLPYVVDFNIFSGDAVVEDYDESEL